MKFVKLTILVLTLSFSGLAASFAQDKSNNFLKTEKQAIAGDVGAQSDLGVLYFYGEGGPRDYKQATKWLTKAAEQGYVEAQGFLGAMYKDGLGIPQDHTQAMKWYTKAAEQGDADAQYNLGDLYANGLGVPENHVLAYKWWSIAIKNGNTQYNIILGGLKEEMTQTQITEGERLADDWLKNH